MKSTNRHLSKALLLLLLIMTALPAIVFPATGADSTVFVSASGNDSASGTESAPFGTLAKAFSALPSGGTVVIKDRYPVNEVDAASTLTLPTHTGRVTVTSHYNGTDYRTVGAALVFPRSTVLSLGGDTLFDNMTMQSAGDEVFVVANFHPVTFGNGFSAECSKQGVKVLTVIGGYYMPTNMNLPANVDSHITIEGGDFKQVVGFSMKGSVGSYIFSGTSNITVSGGRIDTVYGASVGNHTSGSTRFVMTGGTIDSFNAGGDGTRALNGSALVFIGGGELKNLTVNNVAANGVVVLENGHISGKTAVSYANESLEATAKFSKKVLYYNSEHFDAATLAAFGGIAEKNEYTDYKTLDVSKLIYGASLSDIEIKEEILPEKTVFLSASLGSDDGDGSAAHPFRTLTKAITELKYAGGTIVVTDRYVMGEGMVVYDGIPRYNAPQSYKPIVITSVCDGTDYRTAGAALHFPQKSAYLCGGATTFRDLTVTSDVVDVYIAGCFHPLTFDEGFEAKHTRTSEHFLSAIGGYFAPDAYDYPANLDAHLTINSGVFKNAMAFTHVKGIGTYTFTGTSYVTVNGGRIDSFYGASTYNHYSGSLDFTFNGGTIGTLFTGGDVTRRLNGNATLRLLGGTILTSLEINNVIGDTTVYLDATRLMTIRHSYASDTIEKDAYGAKLTLNYNSVMYSVEFVSRFTFFTSVHSFGTAFLQAGATGDGSSEDFPAGTLDRAMTLLGSGGGNIVVLGTYSVSDFTEPTHASPISFRAGKNGKLVLDGRWILAGETAFDSIELSGSCDFIAAGHPIRFGKDLKTDGSFRIFGINDATAPATAVNASVTVAGGTFREVWGVGEGKAGQTFGTVSLAVIGGKVGTVYGTANSGSVAAVDIAIAGDVDRVALASSASPTNRASVVMSAGKIGDLTIAGVTDSLIVRYRAGQIDNTVLTATPSEKILKYDAKSAGSAAVAKLRQLIGNAVEESVVFVKDGGDGNGSSPAMPLGSLADAVSAVSEGGCVVVVGPIAIEESTTLPINKGEILFTSVYDGVDYISEAKAGIAMEADLLFSGAVRIENIALEAMTEGVALIFGGNKATLAEGIVSSHSPDITEYISLVAGSANADSYRSNLTVASGSWSSVIGGNQRAGSISGVNYKVTINGGAFYGKVSASGRGVIGGNAELTINGGTLYAGAFGSAATGKSESYTGKLRLNVNGGVFYCKISPATYRTGTVNGGYELTLNGGDFAHLTDIEGTEKFPGNAEATLVVADSVDLSTELTGRLDFTNPVRRTADPRIILVDGMYYYVYTTGAALSVYKAANIPDLLYSASEPVWDSRNYAEALEGRIDNIWPSELQYFSADDFGEKYEGWYLLFSIYEPAKDGSGNSDGENRRSYVLKSATKDLQGAWVNPETGEEGIPARFVSDTDPTINYKEWTAGQSTMRYNGKVYALWVEQRDRGTSKFRQSALLSEMKNPYTVTGPILTLIEPEYDWEKEGHAYSAAQDLWYPAVIEGLTPMVGEDGQLFVVYAASGYWTPGYCLGQMTFLGGDLFDINNWKKAPQPIFKKNNEVCGTGGPNLATSPDGKETVLLYHAYLGSDTTGYRYCFMEPYFIDSTGFHVGKNGMPSPLSTTFSIAVNGTALYKKISGFANFDGNFLTVADGCTMRRGDNTLPILVYGGKPLDESYGQVSYQYSADGTTFSDGLPREEGTYTVRATLSGNYAYEGLGGSFTVTVASAGGAFSSPLLLPIVILAVVILGTAVAAFFLIKKK